MSNKSIPYAISRHRFSEFAKPVSSKGLCIEDIHLTSDDLEMYIDLAPFLNPSPYVVPEDMSLTKVSIRTSYILPIHKYPSPLVESLIRLN